MKLKFDIEKYKSGSIVKMILYYFCVLFSWSETMFCYLGAFFSDVFYKKAVPCERSDESRRVRGRGYSSKWHCAEAATAILLCFLMKFSYDYDVLSYEIICGQYYVLPTHWLVVYIIMAVVWRFREKNVKKLYSFDIKMAFFICLPVIMRNIFAFLDLRKVYSNVGDVFYEIWSAFFLAALVEEFFFRGYIYELIKKATSVKTAAIISSLIFMLWHTALTRMVFYDFQIDATKNLITVFLLGIIETIIYERTDSLITCVIFHAINNGIIIHILFMFDIFR